MAERHEVTVVTGTKSDTVRTERMEDVGIIRIPALKHDPSRWLYFSYLAGHYIKNLDRQKRFDLVHFLDGHPGYAYRGASVCTLHQSFNQRLKADGGRPYHSSMFNLLKRYPYYRLSRWLEKRAVRNATNLISVSLATKQEFVENYSINPTKIQVIYNGIDTDFFKPVCTNNIKKRLKLDGERIILYVGFSTPRKGVEHLARAFNRLPYRQCKLIMVGKWEKGYREKFYRCLGSSSDRVIEAGYVEDHEMPALYSLADIFVLPSLLEGFGFPIVEAMACKTPVIGTNVGAIPEIIGDCGIVVQPRDCNQLKQAINQLLSDHSKRKLLQTKSRKRVRSLFSETSMIEKTDLFYHKVIRSMKKQQAI